MSFLVLALAHSQCMQQPAMCAFLHCEILPALSHGVDSFILFSDCRCRAGPGGPHRPSRHLPAQPFEATSGRSGGSAAGPEAAMEDTATGRLSGGCLRVRQYHAASSSRHVTTRTCLVLLRFSVVCACAVCLERLRMLWARHATTTTVDYRRQSVVQSAGSCAGMN